MYIGKNLRRLIAASLVVGSLTFMPVTNAEIQTYTGVGEYIMSDFETPEIAKQRAKQYAERNAQEQAGVYVSSYSRVENFKLAEDEIITMTNGILSVTNVKYDIITIPEHAGIVYRATIQANIDTDRVDEWLSKGVGERSELVAKNQALQKAIDDQEKQIADLKKQLEKVKNDKDEEKIKTQFEAADKIFLSNQKLQEGDEQFRWDNDLALTFYNEAIDLNPNNGAAYFSRGCVYIEFQQYSEAADDFNKALSLNINSATLYNNLGYALTELQQYDRAKTYLNKAVSLNPKYSEAYNNLGHLYIKLQKYNEALNYLKKAESMNTASDNIYANLGIAYFELQDYENALYNLDNSIELNSNIPYTLRLRAKCYRMLGNEQQANIDDERAEGLENGTAERMPVG